MNEITVIAAIVCFVIAAVGAWIVYQIFNEKNGPTVGPFRFIEAISERRSTNMGNDIIKLKVDLPEGSHDVVGRELTIKRADDDNGRLPAEQTISTSMMEVEFEAVQDTEVTLSCVAFDNATPTPNRSEPKELTFTVEDTISPEQTGEFSISAIRERPADPVSSEDDSAVAGEGESESETEAAADAETDAEGEPTGEPTAETEAAAEADAKADAEGESTEQPETTPGD